MKISAKEVLNIKLASNDVKEIIGKTVDVTGMTLFDKEVLNKASGEYEVKPIMGFIANGKPYSSPSPTLVEGLKAINEFADAENLTSVKIKFNTKKSNNGREFYNVELA